MSNKVTTIAHKANKKQNKQRVTQSLDVEKALLDRVSNGESLNAICTLPDMPARKTVYEWLKNNPEFLSGYEFAIAMRGEKMAEEIIEIADELPPTDGETGKIDSAWVAWQKNRVDARKWTASRLLPKKYGDKLDVETTLKTVILKDFSGVDK